ncbi:MAG TPA: aldehyde dehydrogenase family protein, partial [Tepidisphaeraceae bacterium]|nr:aldehyde dehydrogenase family protein [Tepidisphaeraceae bacterium]
MAIESKEFTAEDPSTGEVIWRGLSASSEEIRRACSLAYDGYSICGRAKYEERVALIRAFEAKLKSAKDELTDAIARSTGKPMWESATEVDSMIAKIPISIEAFEKRIVDTKRELPGGVVGETVFKPHGTCAVIGPFNFPGHLPNGHIIPALLAGNAVVFKPSELTPLVADIYVRLWQELGRKSQELLQVVHGGAEVGAELIRSGIDAVFFTGSERGGLAIAKALIDRPGVVQALEMGGNNPLIVGRVENVRAAALATIQSAFITAGQRCSCARRLILIGEQREFMDELLRLTDSIRIGAPKDDPAPFMGPVISEAAADRLFEQWNQMVARGGDVLRPLKSIGSRRNFL